MGERDRNVPDLLKEARSLMGWGGRAGQGTENNHVKYVLIH